MRPRGVPARSWLALAALLLVPLSVQRARGGDEPSTASEVLERGRSLPRILDMMLVPGGRPVEGPRTLVLVVDPTESLRALDLPAALGAAFARQRAALGDTRIGVLSATDDAPPSLFGAGARDAAVSRVREILAKTSASVVDVYAAVGRGAAWLKGRAGAREVVLLSLENGDAEEDLEALATTLDHGHVRFSAVGRPAFLCDTYWLTNTSTAPPRGTDFHGPESAFAELPWGWLFQTVAASQSVSSGFPVYGLGRLAAVTGGKVFVTYPPSSGGHVCQVYGTCPLCSGDHLPADDGRYETHRLQALAPSYDARHAVGLAAAHDPWYGAVLDLWDGASKAGLLLGRPPLKRTGAPAKHLVGRLDPLGQSTSFSSLASRADRLLGDLDDLLSRFEQSLAKIDPAAGNPRWRAVAETTRVMLRLTRVNLLLFAAWCREVAPVLAGETAGQVPLPEIPFYPDGTRFQGVGWTPLGLCHGVRPFLQLHLPGGDEVRREIEALDEVVASFLERYAHTPFANVVRQAGLARFFLVVRGKYVPPPKRKVPGASEAATTTEPARPARTGSGGGGTTGPTTGGD